MKTPHVRWMIRRDMPEVLAIEQDSFEYPWSEEDFKRYLRQLNCIGIVAEYDERVMGYMVYSLQKRSIDVQNFAVATAARNNGFGAAMVHRLLAKLSTGRRNRIVLYVRESNLGAQLFFSKMGFRAIGIKSGLYDDTSEDGYLFQYRLPVLAATAIREVTRCR